MIRAARVGENQKPGRSRPGLSLGTPTLGGRGSLGSTLHGDRLRHLADKEGLKVRLIASPLQAYDGVPRLARHEVAFSGWAGYFKLAVLALQSLGNVIRRNALVQLHGDFLQSPLLRLLVWLVPPREGIRP